MLADRSVHFIANIWVYTNFFTKISFTQILCSQNHCNTKVSKMKHAVTKIHVLQHQNNLSGKVSIF